MCQSRTITGYPDALATAFDAAGNRTRREVNPDQQGPDDAWLYVYDAWNRLVRVEVDPLGDGQTVQTRAVYTYNGLHQRASRRADGDLDGDVDAADPGHLYYYDAAWRLCEERIDDAWDGSLTGPAAFSADRIVQRLWCPLYIDALIAMQTDVDSDANFGDTGPPDGDFTDPDASIMYALCDRKYDVIAMTSASGTILERIAYTPYGVAKQRLRADLNGDGVVNGGDITPILGAFGAGIGTPNYSPDADLNGDGTVNGADIGLINNYSGPAGALPGQVSAFGNTVGYSGYLYDDAVNLSLARFRWYDTESGRWSSRDPIGYLNISESLYEYCITNPLNWLDPDGRVVISACVTIGTGVLFCYKVVKTCINADAGESKREACRAARQARIDCHAAPGGCSRLLDHIYVTQIKQSCPPALASAAQLAHDIMDIAPSGPRLRGPDMPIRKPRDPMRGRDPHHSYPLPANGSGPHPGSDPEYYWNPYYPWGHRGSDPGTVIN